MRIIYNGIELEIDKTLLNQKEAARFLGVSVNTFKSKYRDELKNVNINGKPRFSIFQLLELLNKNMINEAEIKAKKILNEIGV